MISFDKFQETITDSRKSGMNKYKDIMTQFHENINIADSREFQKKFNGFYRIRRDQTWQKAYYDYFDANKKNKNITFDEILNYMYEKTSRCEASFCSKMLHTINPDMPIWDKFVLKNLDIKIGNTKNNKSESIKSHYKEIIDWFDKELKKESTKKEIKKFRKHYPGFDFSDVKILDFFLWNKRD